ncbi:hypothetical protein [Brevibacterium salitolerans]|uniref:Uncharacterized protein n=1 Tax=Brevibacterium salitolerans TaxID=1403566 RepID=A0ABN2X8I1_9MICO
MSLYMRVVSTASAALIALTGGIAAGPASAQQPEAPVFAVTAPEQQPEQSAAPTSAPAAPTEEASPSPTPTPRPTVLAGEVSISGTAKVGSTLTAAAGTWQPDSVTLSYQWLRSGTAIKDATRKTYTLTAADKGRKISVRVTGSAPDASSATVTSAPTPAVKAGTLTTRKPTISGTTTVGSTLTAKPGSWGPNPVSLSYQWMRAGKAIKNATRSTYTLTSADAGRKLSVKVTGTKSGYTAASRTSAATGTIGKRLTATPVPTISGTAKVGSTLTAKAGTWKPAKVTLSYQWYRNGKAIKEATGNKHKLVKADAGTALTVKVTGRKPGYTTVSRKSAAKTVQKVLTSTPTPTISGTRKYGSTLTAKAGAWKPAKVTLSYQWYRNGKAIKEATGSKHKLVKADVGTRLSVKVTGRKSGYTTVTKTSASTAKITYPSSTGPGYSGWDCPAWAPIKGNADSMIYHVKGGAFYDRTNPEECFRTEAAAKAAGYRRSKR